MQPAQARAAKSHQHDGVFYGLCGNPERTQLFAGSTDGRVHVFDNIHTALDPANGQPVVARQWHEKHGNYVVSLAYVRSARGENVISASYDGTLVWWDAPSGGAIRQVEAHDGWVRQVATTPDGAHVISVGDDMQVKVWDAESHQAIRVLAGHARLTPEGFATALYALAISPDGKHVAAGDRVGEVRVWELSSGRQVAAFRVPELYTFDNRQRKRSIGGVRALAFSPSGNHLAIGGIGQVGNVDGLEAPAHVEVWDWQRPARVLAAKATGHKSILNALAYDRAGRYLIGAGGGGDNGLLAFWDVGSALAQASEREKGTEETAPQNSPREKDAANEPGVEAVMTKYKFDGHAHAAVWDEDRLRLYLAGFGKLEVWDLSEPPG